jgi:hypothetical protein
MDWDVPPAAIDLGGVSRNLGRNALVPAALLAEREAVSDTIQEGGHG